MAEESDSVRVGMAGGEPGIGALPESCIANAISLTSPRDASRSSAVSTAFCSAVASDTVWDRFLPSDLKPILDRADQPVDFSSKRELFFRLCNRPIFLDGGKMPNKNRDTDVEATGHVVPQSRGNGWMEIELGELYNNGEEGEDEEVVISLLEVKGGHWKCGLIIEGIEIRH